VTARSYVKVRQLWSRNGAENELHEFCCLAGQIETNRFILTYDPD
jgi:hypothetical protein